MIMNYPLEGRVNYKLGKKNIFTLWNFFRFSIFSLPLSVKFFLPGLGSEVIFPGEIFVGILAVLFFYNILWRRSHFTIGKNFLVHPVTILIVLYLTINIVSAFCSTMPLVSFKALVVKSSYIVVFYFFVHILIKQATGRFLEMLSLYGFSLVLVVIYALLSQIHIGLNRDGAGYASFPFYNDHTIFAAVIAFILPIFISFPFFPEIRSGNRLQLILIFITLLLFLFGFYFSYCRAAWISACVSFLLFLIIKSGGRFYTLVFFSVSVMLIAALNFDSLVSHFKKNRVNSHGLNAGFYEQVFSLTNISNDASNAERINRWKCSIRMFKDKPIIGFGPGTYQFQYLSYQKEEETTYLSLHTSLIPGSTSYLWNSGDGLKLDILDKNLQGRGGTAHSEYFLALSETGIFSLITFIGIMIVSLYCALRSYARYADRKLKPIILCSLLGLISFFVHALFNNFLDDCKISFLFWSSLCFLSTVDVARNKNE
jgi:putative inorganic carbon (HCO3(-)) transporter